MIVVRPTKKTKQKKNLKRKKVEVCFMFLSVTWEKKDVLRTMGRVGGRLQHFIRTVAKKQ